MTTGTLEAENGQMTEPGHDTISYPVGPLQRRIQQQIHKNNNKH